MLWLVNPDEEILDWKAVCGKTARTVWREGRVERLFSTPIMVLKFEPGTASFVQLKSLNLMAVMLQRGNATRDASASPNAEALQDEFPLWNVGTM